MRQAYDYWQDQPGFSGEGIFRKKNNLLGVTELTDTIYISCAEVHWNEKFLDHTNDTAQAKDDLKRKLNRAVTRTDKASQFWNCEATLDAKLKNTADVKIQTP